MGNTAAKPNGKHHIGSIHDYLEYYGPLTETASAHDAEGTDGTSSVPRRTAGDRLTTKEEFDSIKPNSTLAVCVQIAPNGLTKSENEWAYNTYDLNILAMLRRSDNAIEYRTIYVIELPSSVADSLLDDYNTLMAAGKAAYLEADVRHSSHLGSADISDEFTVSYGLSRRIRLLTD
jgi:hypothetical protein